jgi:hypothetical protein
MRDSKNMAEKTQNDLVLAPPAAGQELITGACNELFKDAYAGLLSDRPRKTLNFENLFDLSSEFSPDELFKENISTRLVS